MTQDKAPDINGLSGDLTSLMSDLDSTSDIANTLAKEISEKCTSSLDAYIHYVSEELRTTQSLSNEALDKFILNLPIYIYYASSTIESLGIKEDVSAISKKREITNQIEKLKHDNAGGTVASRTAIAEANCTDHILVNSIYSSAYKIAKSKIEFAYEVLASCKKVMSRRIEELKAFNSDTKRNSGNKQDY